ncbi:MAG: serine hydrolase [Elusimicrobia bacterium]|nr:serine hydrolase [Elusimicrobiota bacterium]
MGSKSNSNERLGAGRRSRLGRLDLMLGCSLAVVATAYILGYQLDWGQADAPFEEEEMAVEREEASSEPELEASAREPSWSPNPTDAAWEQMTSHLSSLAARHTGRVAIYLKDLSSGRTWSYHEDDLFPSASLIKVPIMASVFYKIKDGELSLYDKLTLRRRHRTGGSGSLKWRSDGTRLTVRELLQHLISESDNTAMQILIEAVGLGYIQQHFPRMGLVYTGIYREGLSLRSGRVSHENYTTAREMAGLLEKIYSGEMVDRSSSQIMMEILKHKKAVRSRLAKDLPKGWEIAHKTGLLRTACHDSAVFLTPRGDYLMIVLTGQNNNYRLAKNFISKLGKATFVHYGGIPSYYAKAYTKRSGNIALR